LKTKLPLLAEVVVAETCTARAVYRGECIQVLTVRTMARLPCSRKIRKC
jgi:hypothetical protein